MILSNIPILIGQYFAKMMFTSTIMQQVTLLTFQHLLFPQVAQEAQDLEEGLLEEKRHRALI